MAGLASATSEPTRIDIPENLDDLGRPLGAPAGRGPSIGQIYRQYPRPASAEVDIDAGSGRTRMCAPAGR